MTPIRPLKTVLKTLGNPPRLFKRSIAAASVPVILAAIMMMSVSAVPVFALEADPDEKERLENCERNLCRTVLNKDPANGNLSCKISKTWNRSKIKKGAGTKSLKWGYGDAKCNLDLKLNRKQVQIAMSSKKHKVFFDPHTITCQVETEGGTKPVNVTLNPTLKFKNGKVRKVTLKVKKIEGPTMLRSLIWSTVNLEKTLGIFHGQMVEEINEFLHHKCPERHG
ncbi:MAG: hypothetical protein AAFV45_01085 [Pseudomonadota bacterium]